MSKEVLQAAGDIVYWRRRAEQAEADAAALKQELADRHTCERCGGGRGYYYTDVNGEGVAEVCDCWIRADHVIYHEEHPGATLLAELEAARRIVATLRRHRDAGGEVWGSIDRDFEAYDAAVKARSE